MPDCGTRLAAAASVQLRLVEDPQSLWPRRDEWNALVARSATNTVFQTLEWQCSWWRAFGAQARGLVLVVEEAGALVGIAPLMLSQRRILGRRRRVVEFIGAHAADYCDFIVEPRDRAVAVAMLRWLLERADRWDLLHLLNLAETSPLRELAGEAFAGRGYTIDLHALYECPTRILGDRQADERMLRKKDIREHLNQLRRRGKLEFTLHQAAADMDLEGFFRQHIERWADTQTPSFFAWDPRQRRFYQDVVGTLAPRGWVVFSALSLDGAPLSFHFGYQYGGRLYSIKSTFDPRFRQYSPGLLHLRFMLEYALTRGARELDLTVGEEAYKYRFANHARKNYVARIYRPALFYGLDRLAATGKALARRSPVALRLGRALRRRYGQTLHLLGL